ncbi:MAG TPA: 2-phospho-L-lactate guanylyltransferase, partial [Xanthobacteraceae bacterium]|nr:2-phospho-L-lactate guanylyltransferase [Xanthobacteraceae bacterium]
MSVSRKICVVVPVKDTVQAKQRLAALLPAERRQELALAMFEDVIAAVSNVRELADITVVTIDSTAAAIAARHGARVMSEGACEGHTGAVMTAARHLAAEGCDLLTLPGDIPLVEPSDVRQLIRAHGIRADRGASAFTIVPARDELGSNAVLCSPAGAVPLRFGDNSFFPHLDAAKAHGIDPEVVHLPRIALDIDTPEDLALFVRTPSQT